jgi:hypothetical protein
MLDLTVVGAPRLLADQIADDIEKAGAIPGRYSWRVKASQLAGDCLAQQWYAFRWVRKLPIGAQLARIFEFGKRREDVFVELLRKAGWTVLDVDPSRAHTRFPQWRVVDLDGHLSAYIDAKVSHPVFTDGALWLGEFKTMNKQKFALLTSKKAIQSVSAEYYGQVCIYMRKKGLPYTLLLVECKDNQEIYIEIIPANNEYADKLLHYGDTIRSTRIRPSRVAESPAFHVCKMCDFMNICHMGAPVDVNCRSCVSAEAAPDGQFYCTRWRAIIPNEQAIMQACAYHEPVK